jgi:hypothetical protein
MPSLSIEVPKDVSALVRYVSSAPEGQRNNILHWAACRAAEAGTLGTSEIDAFLSAAVQAGLNPEESRKTIASAARRSKIA